MYKWIQLSSSADIAQIKAHITAEYDPARVVEKLTNGISNAVKAILIEYNYVDKDYRSAYYNFYVKKGQHYRADCVRLHFFDGTVTFDNRTLRLASSADERLNDHYFGYMILRPTGIRTIGRTVVSPDVRSGASRCIITANHKVHILGYKFEIEGFPSMDQHHDIAVCAHAACWSILRHYSERYSMYREFLTHEITMMAHQFDPGGLIPSKGLEVSHAERIFQQAGTYPVHIARRTDDPKDLSFYRQLTAYVESGFPLFAAMNNQGHAIAIVGYEWRTPVNTAIPGVRYTWDEIQSLAVIDDNHLPYLSIPISGGALYSAEDIDAFIVALPEKVYYPADMVDRMAATLFELDAVVELPAKDETIIRYFITTGAGFRQFVRGRESEFDPKLLATIMTLPFAQFVWIIEFATERQWAVGQIAARAVVDATASLHEILPLWLLHNCTEALVFKRRTVSLNLQTDMGVLTLSNMGHTGFTRMEQNLRPTQTK